MLGLAISAAIWIWQKDKADAVEIASLRQSVDQRPELVDRRNREQDALKQCLERQIDIMLRCR